MTHLQQRGLAETESGGGGAAVSGVTPQLPHHHHHPISCLATLRFLGVGKHFVMPANEYTTATFIVHIKKKKKITTKLSSQLEKRIGFVFSRFRAYLRFAKSRLDASCFVLTSIHQTIANRSVKCYQAMCKINILYLLHNK